MVGSVVQSFLSPDYGLVFRLLVLLKTLMDDDIEDNRNYLANKPLPDVDGS